MSNTRINTTKINELPETTVLSDSDISLKDNGITTNKFKLSTLIQYIKNHTEISNFFVHKSSINATSGIAPLDSDKKIPSANIKYGKTAGTIYQGSEGAALESTVNNHVLDKNNPHDVTKSQVGLSNVNNTSDANKPVSIAQQSALNTAYTNSNLYTDTKINALINGAPETLNTLKEVADAIQNNDTVVDALNNAIGTKANQTELDTHTGNNTIHITSAEHTGLTDTISKKHEHNNKFTLDKLSETNGILKFNGKEISGGDSGGLLMGYGLCSTDASTITKVVECLGFALIVGNEITVKFAVTNNASSPTLNVNNTGAKPIFYRGSAISPGYLAANRTYKFSYNGTQYDLVGDLDTNSNNAVTQTITNTTNANYRMLFSVTADDTTRTEGVRKDTNLTYNPSTNTLNVSKVSGLAAKATADATGNEIINQKTSSTEPINQKVGDYWVKEY